MKEKKKVEKERKVIKNTAKNKYVWLLNRC